MPTETLHFENARLAQQLFNNDSHNLQVLEENLGVKATSREGWIKLEGRAEDIERARQMFQLLEASAKSGSPVRSREFAHALNVIKHEGVSALQDLYAERIHTSSKKAHVTPKTVAKWTSASAPKAWTACGTVLHGLIHCQAKQSLPHA